MSKHAKPIERPARHLAPTLWVGGFLLLGVLFILMALAPSDDPLDQPNVIPAGATPVDVVQRSLDAGAVARDAERVQTLPDRREEYVARQKELRQEARQERREELRQQALEEATTPVVESEPTQTNTPRNGAGNSGTMPDLLVSIRAHESGGNYSAYNPTGCSDQNGTFSCGGAYQLSSQYASVWAARSGYQMSSQAQEWPAEIQDAVALDLFYASNPDGAMWCDFTSYC